MTEEELGLNTIAVAHAAYDTMQRKLDEAAPSDEGRPGGPQSRS